MKKIIKLIISILLAFMIIIFVDFVFLKINNKPLIYIKQTREEQEMTIYNGLLYRVVECTAEDGNFTIMGYTKKIADNYCPRTTHMDYNDGYIINSKGVKISKEDFDILYKYYSISEIDNMDSESVKENVANLKKQKN
ncbi:MAG: hypothetical protein J6C28_01605 [Bacilli bacterium]|nr:hypothetical protein [Bacilli bacterium]